MKKKISMRRRMTTVVISSMLVLLVLQTFPILYFLKQNDINKQEYLDQLCQTEAASLNNLGESLESIGNYLSVYSSFNELYSVGYNDKRGDAVVNAFNSIRLIALNYPIIKDVVVVERTGIMSSFLYGDSASVEIIETVKEDLKLEDPEYIKKKFYYVKGMPYFAYSVPISGIYATTKDYDKIATAMIFCDVNYIRNLINIDEINMSIFDQNGDLFMEKINQKSSNFESVSYSDVMGLKVMLYGNPSGAATEIQFIMQFYTLSVAVLIITLLLTWYIFQKTVAKPISNLVSESQNFTRIGLKKRLGYSEIDEINSIVFSFNSMLNELETMTRNAFKTQERLYETQIRTNEAELYALQSQINPHFLYNTLQCIRSIAIIKHVNEIADISLAMSELFRYSIAGGEYTELQDELSILNQYITIMKIRFLGKIEFQVNYDERLLSCRCLKMMIQPLVENAVYHGVSQLEEGGVVDINLWEEQNVVHVSVVDNGYGMSEEKQREVEEVLSQDFKSSIATKKTRGYGIYNIHRRLKLKYGKEYGLMFKRENSLTTVDISFPMEEEL